MTAPESDVPGHEDAITRLTRQRDAALIQLHAEYSRIERQGGTAGHADRMLALDGFRVSEGRVEEIEKPKITGGVETPDAPIETLSVGDTVRCLDRNKEAKITEAHRDQHLIYLLRYGGGVRCWKSHDRVELVCKAASPPVTFEINQRIRVINPDAENAALAGISGTVRTVSLFEPWSAWVEMDVDLPANLRSFPPNSSRCRHVRLYSDECAAEDQRGLIGTQNA